MVFENTLKVFQNSNMYGELMKSDGGKKLVTKFFKLVQYGEKLSGVEKVVFDSEFSTELQLRLNKIESSLKEEKPSAENEFPIVYVIVIFLGMMKNLYENNYMSFKFIFFISAFFAIRFLGRTLTNKKTINKKIKKSQ